MWYHTKNCINHPNRKAVCWTGHVHLGNKNIISGWCGVCRKKAERHAAFKKICKKRSQSYPGCDGRYKKEFGLEKD